MRAALFVFDDLAFPDIYDCVIRLSEIRICILLRVDLAGRCLVWFDVHSHFWCHGVEVGLVADVEILARVSNLVLDARLEVSDSHLVERRERRELLKSYVALDGG